MRLNDSPPLTRDGYLSLVELARSGATLTDTGTDQRQQEALEVLSRNPSDQGSLEWAVKQAPPL